MPTNYPGAQDTSITLPKPTGPVSSPAHELLHANEIDAILALEANAIVLATLVTKTTTYAILTTDNVILCNASGGAFTVTLPTAVSVTGKQYTIKKTDSTLNVVTVATTSSQTIDGATTNVIATPYESITVVSDGSNWMIV